MGGMAAVANAKRLRCSVSGIVQGVGFRPFIYRLAKQAGLSGSVRNTASGVCIEVQSADASKLDRFFSDMKEKAPPLSRISSVAITEIPATADTDFTLVSSDNEGSVQTLVSPDIAICNECRNELRDPSDRRYAYPFINCTNCGPRYTIIEQIPYDRPSTSMKQFTMCPECDREYHDPMSRRFHAQPNACQLCGPALQLLDSEGNPVECSDPVGYAAAMLKSSRIIAVKGIGGFHLAVNAFDDSAISRLRKRKQREKKPFALMAKDLATAARFCHIDDSERRALCSPEAPVVLLKQKEKDGLSGEIAPGNNRLGMMLPYSPLHVLLMERAPDVLVMTSANSADEPIAIDNREAVQRLGGIADYFLVHDRPVYLGCDDSVTIHLAGRLRQIRRSRGYVPAPVPLVSGGEVVLAAGAEIKNTVCLLKEDRAILSQHIGDLKNYESYVHYRKVVDHLQHIFQTSPALIVGDMHPAYISTQWALEQKKTPVLFVQHHHAHLVSCLAENHCKEPAIGVILDGTGYGNDGSIWGGEVLIGDASGARRFASLEPVALPGGDAVVFSPWKTAAGYLYHTFKALPDLDVFRDKDVAGVLQMLEKGINSPLTSSCGRLFDAVAAITGICRESSYEGQAAIELMHAAGSLEGEPFSRQIVPAAGNRWQLSVSPLIREIVTAVQSGVKSAVVSRRFHVTIVWLLTAIVKKATAATGIRTVALSGGVFQNELLFEGLHAQLEKEGFSVLTQSQVPSNDGGISLGQAVIGRGYLKGTYRGITDETP